MENTRKWRWGVNRWLVLLFTVLGAIAASIYPPIAPHIQVAPENLTTQPLFTAPWIGAFYLTNTMVASILVLGIIFIMALSVKRAMKSGDLVPRGVPGAIEYLIEGLYNLTANTAGRWAKDIFPFFATIVIMVLLANWMELIPGVDSIGFLHHVEGAEGHPAAQILPGLQAIVKGDGGGYSIVPWVRVASTDLNFTLALALVSVVMTQVIGVRAQGARYFFKFFNVTTLFSKPGFGAMDFAVSLLELISEFSRILSFTFRLFGNIFAGSVLLFLVGSLVPIFAQSAILLFEFFIGLIQALVFGMLTMVFMTMATQGHGGEHEEGHEAAAAQA